ncbi:helix-turn-helix domain-containing protein [Nocardioides sp. W7]|uniref:helix-turn-helix domain-containing protein n=1 Tax=Nocardioides sp. W7 TaxID=2931390 RepID=UPI001FD5D2F3|nr:helix-turn-helix domain-containing protein [Nocardioides sp. W7]
MPDRPDELTLRILALIADGATAAEAAAACNVSESTLNRRLQALRRQWELENNMQVLVRAVRIGLV